MPKYKHAGIAGKFRLLHKAHIELILRAMSLTEHLHVFIVDLPSYKRYASVENLKQSFIEIFETIHFDNYHLHVITEDLSGIAWDEKILSLVPELETMFDSKEDYGNILVNNEFIKLDASEAISVTAIEKNIYQKDNFYLITKEFRKYLNKKIVISGKPKQGITTLTNKLGYYYNVTTYVGFNQVIDNLYSELNAHKLLFPEYIERHISSIVHQFLDARRMLLINDDLIKLYYYIVKNEDDLMNSAILCKNDFKIIYNKFESFLLSFIESVDTYIYCTNNIENDELLLFYQKFVPEEKLKIIEFQTYIESFDASIIQINNFMQING